MGEVGGSGIRNRTCLGSGWARPPRGHRGGLSGFGGLQFRLGPPYPASYSVETIFWATNCPWDPSPGFLDRIYVSLTVWKCGLTPSQAVLGGESVSEATGPGHGW